MRALKAFWILPILAFSSLNHASEAPHALLQKDARPVNIRQWEISRDFPANQVDKRTYPRFYLIFYAQWRKAETEPSGCLDMARIVKKTAAAPGCVFARKLFCADKDAKVRLHVGYRGNASLFFNGKRVFSGKRAEPEKAADKSRTLECTDSVDLDVHKGLNEIFFLISETSGGWALKVHSESALAPRRKEHHRVEKLWETGPAFLTPESVLYDAKRNILYVTSFDNQYASKREPSGFVSKVNLQGEIEELKWVTGLRGPCGMAMKGDALFVVERYNLVEIDAAGGKIVKKYPIAGSTFLNDIVFDAEGNLYISDSFPAVPGKTKAIYKFRDGKIEPWMDSDALSRVNGLYVHRNSLLVGNTGDSSLKAVSFKDKKLTTLARLGVGVVDGIRTDKAGNLLVSHWEGQLFRISSAGDIVEILDTLPQGRNCADFEFIKEKNIIIIPTFVANRVAAYKIKE